MNEGEGFVYAACCDTFISEYEFLKCDLCGHLCCEEHYNMEENCCMECPKYE